MRARFYDEPGDAGLSGPDVYDPGYDLDPDDDWPGVPLRPWGWWRQGWSRRGRRWPGRVAPASRYVRPPRKPGTTRDGYRLRLPHAGVHTILARLEPGQLRALAGGDLGGDPAGSVVRSVARIAGDARLVGTMRSRRTGARFPVFSGPGFRILARPTGRMQGEILLVRPAAGAMESETGPAAPATPGTARIRLRWNPRFPLGTASAAPKTKKSLYVLVRDGTPIYVGEALGTGLYDRLKEYRRNAHIFRVPPETLQVDATAVEDFGGRKGFDVESLLLRLLIRVFGKDQIRNSNRQVNPFPVGPAEVVMEHTGAVPPYLRRPLELMDSKGKTYGRHTVTGSGAETRFFANVEFEVPEPSLARG